MEANFDVIIQRAKTDFLQAIYIPEFITLFL